MTMISNATRFPVADGTSPRTTNGAHVPVLRDEAIDLLDLREGGIYVDGTFGAGGYTREILRRTPCFVCAIDRDPAAVRRGRRMARDFPGRLIMMHGRFGEMGQLLRDRGIDRVDGVTLDLGVSSMQIDAPDRGFSFRHQGPLDMRMDNSPDEGPSAADLVNSWSERELADIIFTYGEERHARAVARAIVAARLDGPIATTGRLAEIVRSVVKPGRDKIDPATRTFQALRIKVNDELGELERGLAAAESLLKPNGRLSVVSFHSLEDRVVKSFLRVRCGAAPNPSRHLPELLRKRPPTLRLLTGKAVRPSLREAENNPRARSGKLRAAERTDAPMFEEESRGGGQA
ncbi:MAG: 16S rRNA (cytosine(1402)-N(4))-methyltransferase RsmH [Alphaproteobacteria bacterium]